MTPKAEPRRRVGGACPVRVLVVEDFVPFRQFILSMLASMPDLRVIGEVSDGLDAVHKSAERQPDLVLLDIGLPGLNGIEAARRIRKLVFPEPKIIFLTQESSFDVLQEALGLGAQGYVVKTMAESELLTAVETVLSGKTFVSSTEPNLEFRPAAPNRYRVM
jgi:DNA-binding NarL/FixJ family response regulator